MGVRMTDSSFSAHKPHALDTDVDGFPLPSASTTAAADFNARLANPRWRPRPSPLAILRERLFSNSGSRDKTFGYPRHAPSLNGERRSHSIKSRLGFSFRFGSRGRDFF